MSFRINCWMSSGLKCVAAEPSAGRKNINLAVAIISHHGHRPASAR